MVSLMRGTNGQSSYVGVGVKVMVEMEVTGIRVGVIRDTTSPVNITLSRTFIESLYGEKGGGEGGRGY